jgi:hypothetical protein
MISPARALIATFTLCILLGSVSASAQTTFPEVSTSGSISSHSIGENEQLQFTLSIANKGNPKIVNAALRNVTLTQLPDGYRLVTICVIPAAPLPPNPCQTGDEFNANKKRLAGTLVPGQSIIVTGYLKPDSIHKAASLTALLEWTLYDSTFPASGLASARVVNLGENQVQSASWWGRVSIDEILKVLAVPALLLVIGALIGLLVNALNSLRDKRAHKNEAERSLRSETWKQMLPVSHNYAAKFYLPLSLAADRFSKNLKKKNYRVAFFYLLFSGKKVIATRNEIGGFYFKDLRGEALAANCWEKQRLACMGEEDTPFFLAVRASIDQLEDIESYEAFESMFASTPGGDFSSDSIPEAWTFFQKWVADNKTVADTISYLDGFTAVMDYESNRPYQYWYDTKPRLVATDDTKELLRKILTSEKYGDEDIENYLSAVVAP